MLNQLKTKLSLVNWQYQLYKIAFVALIAVSWSWFMWDKGKDYCEKQHSIAVVDQVIESVNERLPVIQQAERGAAQMEQELKQIKEKLDEEATNKPSSDCGLTDEQWMLFNEAAKKTEP